MRDETVGLLAAGIICMSALVAFAGVHTYQYFTQHSRLLCCTREEADDITDQQRRDADGELIGNAQAKRGEDNRDGCIANRGKPMFVPLDDHKGHIIFVYEGCL